MSVHTAQYSHSCPCLLEPRRALQLSPSCCWIMFHLKDSNQVAMHKLYFWECRRSWSAMATHVKATTLCGMHPGGETWVNSVLVSSGLCGQSMWLLGLPRAASKPPYFSSLREWHTLMLPTVTLNLIWSIGRSPVCTYSTVFLQNVVNSANPRCV